MVDFRTAVLTSAGPDRGAAARARIFHAAIAVALQKGFGKVTLSLVASEAGLSKGGLLHHFATKNALIRGMLEFYEDRTAPNARLDDANQCACDPLAVAVLIAAFERPTVLEEVRMQPDAERPDLKDRQESPRHSRLAGTLIAKVNLAAAR
ncbi:TetR/AcrR family transcriptional regulator [Aquamicrobium defluvii]|uniref:TetR family transcriptional regulator n=1 Tax=Aquamicrobium defluvii TaxID=69279 RepID=A0A011TDP8_9HYPH|nr:TetR/AcrR family transcriptional regulator [Aquamicrobium defluvii]EXL02017.1 hypothetical protein BG36_16375 [Aquamicrobium defluvii]EZQ13600.1 hypothetical protein CF98_27215 [Halopseudomonas bauzanensis]TDR35299.1 TetR family transcriptional regulator [Aquamicrobium defluvii]